MSLHQQNSQRSRFNPYFQTTSNGPNQLNENPQVQETGRNTKERSNTTRLYENSFINKTYQNVRSFGKDLSNIQQNQEAKQAYGDIGKQGSLHQQPKILRVKSQIGNTASTGQPKRFLSNRENINTTNNEQLPQQQLPSKFIITKERRVGNSQEGRVNISSKGTKEMIQGPQISHINAHGSLIMNIPQFNQTLNSNCLPSISSTHQTTEDEYQMKQFLPKSSQITPELERFEVDKEMTDSKLQDDKPSVLRRFWEETLQNYYANDVCEIDRDDVANPQCIAEFAEECCQHMLTTEKDHIPKVGYMSQQNDINERMRAILVDWLIEVHYKFKLLPETLFLTINLIDRFLEKSIIHRTKLQLVGVTSMLIASKYEEIYAPEVRDFVYITDKAYTKEEILKMEQQILMTLNFDICAPSSYRFLERFSKIGNITPKQFSLARYLIELPLIEYRMLKYCPSNLAASALFLTLKIIPRVDETSGQNLSAWDELLTKHSTYQENSLRPCAKDLCILLQGIEKCSLQAVRKKFSSATHNEVALIRLEH